MNANIKRIYVLLVIVVIVLVLIYAQVVIIPFVLAILFWFLIRDLRRLIAKIKYVRCLPQWILTLIASILLLAIIVFGVSMISQNIQQLTRTLPLYEDNVYKITETLNERFNIQIESLIGDYSKKMNFGGILSSIFVALTNIFGSAVTILLYLIFILYEEPIFEKKLKLMYPDHERYQYVSLLVDRIGKSISDYISLKTIVSLLTGVLAYISLLIIGVDAPLFWSFLIFILNYIPNIGSLIASIFPTIFAFLQFGDLTHGLLVLGIVGSIQLAVGNIVEPRLMGNSLNVSPLVVLLTLALWGVMWGITGMMLSVPITIIIIIILSEFPSTRPMAVLLSEKGNILNRVHKVLVKKES